MKGLSRAASAQLRQVLLAGGLVASLGMASPAQTAEPDDTARPASKVQDARPITPDDIQALTGVHDPQIAPDGAQVLYVTQPRLATGAPDRSEIWIAARDRASPPVRLTQGTWKEGGPRWSPDGTAIAYLSNRKAPDDATGTATRQIWIVRPGREAPRPVTRFEDGVRSFAWAPDGQSLAVLARAPHEDTAHPIKEVDAPGTPVDLWIQDLASGAVRRIAVKGRTLSDVSWSPDGTRIAVRAAATSGLNDRFYHSELRVLDVASGTSLRTLRESAYSGASWSPDSRKVAFTAPAQGTIGIDAFVADVASGRVRKVGADLDGTIRQIVWSGEADTLLARAVVHTRQQIVRIDARTERASPFVPFEGRITDFSVAADGQIAFAASTPERPADIWIHGDATLTALTDLNPQIRGIALGSVEEVQWTSQRDGQTIYGVLVLPPDHVPGSPRKTVVLAHGGPHEAWATAWQGSWIDWAQLLASHGYAVLLPNPRGSAGQGNAYARGVISGWGTRDYQDLTDGVDMLVARGIADPARLGIGGWSYGGFLSAWAVTHDRRFRTAVIGAAPTDPLTLALATDTPDFVTAYFGLPPEAIARMDRSAPLRALDKVSVPVLVLHGEEDARVPLSQGLAFYRGLRLLGKPASMVTYPGEPHRIGGPDHQRDIQERVLAWFDAHL
ncbi:alpha/beta hydrolase family protein [Novosphingobium decolorationis]|uniref:S9 family peptidase n=1 Tax=Novosphingobium decolorationis TaxID=2698673 RepID=A0ABX8E537_9SPHN|nr:S9 family peptidase [Novosphingobium decolorationis]QVM84119.1 S9 family peptidase [Novosphingobium decolorationis]